MSTSYSHVFTRDATVQIARVAPRPLCVFRVLFQGVPVPDPIDGKEIEHGSQWAAETRATRLAREYGTARENFIVARSWI